jgi:hypothetical protein
MATTDLRETPAFEIPAAPRFDKRRRPSWQYISRLTPQMDRDEFQILPSPEWWQNLKFVPIHSAEGRFSSDRP